MDESRTTTTEFVPVDDESENNTDERDWTNTSETDIYLPGSINRLHEGIMWERILKDSIEKRILNHHLETLLNSCTTIDYDKDPQAQKAGIDGAFGGYDLKTRKNKAFSEANPDVYIEIDSNKDEKTPWGFNESSTFVPYCWEDESRQNIKESVMIIKKEGFNEWLDRVSSNHNHKKSGNTTAVAVPVSDIPETFIDKHIDLTMEKGLPKPIDEFIKYTRAVDHFRGE